MTGGLAAPLIAAGAASIIGSAGAAALGSVAGIAVMTSLFGAAGASLTGKVPEEGAVRRVDPPRFSPVMAPREMEEEHTAFLMLGPRPAGTSSRLPRELGDRSARVGVRVALEKMHLV